MKKLYAPLARIGLLSLGCGGGGDAADAAADVKPRDEVAAAEEAVADAAHAGDAVAGEAQYMQLCSACHGPDAKGLPSLGKDLTTSDFVATSSDAEFVEFIKVGRPSGDPENTTGIDMPPKGGNPALTDAEIMDIVAYVRTLEE